MPVSLLLLQVDRGPVADELCGGCRFAHPSNRGLRRKGSPSSERAMWCQAFREWCLGPYDRPMRVDDCLKAEAEAHRD